MLAPLLINILPQFLDIAIFDITCSTHMLLVCSECKERTDYFYTGTITIYISFILC